MISIVHDHINLHNSIKMIFHFPNMTFLYWFKLCNLVWFLSPNSDRVPDGFTQYLALSFKRIQHSCCKPPI